MEANGIAAAMNETKTTVLHIAIDGEYRGSIEVEDTIKEDSVEAIQRIKELGVAHTVMLTGDREEVAAHIAHEAGLDEYHAGLLPEGKIDFLRSYLDEAPKGEKVAFVGDGNFLTCGRWHQRCTSAHPLRRRHRHGCHGFGCSHRSG